MVPRSLSLLSSASSPSSFPPNFTADSPSPAPFSFRRVPRFPCLNVFSSSSSSKQQLFIDNNDSPEQFLKNNSIADFMRFKKGRSNAAELQTAVVTYRKKFPWSILQPFLQVDLVSTIHIADKEYFAALQKELEPYDCILYEMVASRESLDGRKSSISRRKLKSSRSRGFNIIGFIQRQMARFLTLDFQLDCLDYEGENWYHADLDFETFKLLQVLCGNSAAKSVTS